MPSTTLFLAPLIRTGAALACFTALLLLSSCEPLEGLLGKRSQSEIEVRLVNAFAIVDLDEIARRLGRDQALRQALQMREAELSGSLTQVRDQYYQQALTLQEQLGSQPSEEDQQKLAGVINQMNTKLAELQQQANLTLSQEQLVLIQNFRNEVLPFAMDIARERGLVTILLKNENLIFAFDPSADITEEIVLRMGTPIIP